MAGFALSVAIYLIGGVTFIPLLLVSILIHAHFTFPYRETGHTVPKPESLLRSGDDTDAVKKASAGLDEKFRSRGAQSNDVFAGYFAVCREYVPAGVGAKPPERTTPAGSTTISSPSPSVYQTMYRSIFDRKPSTSPIEIKGASRPTNKGGNIFYVVLRHNHLMLFDDEEQIEVRYVISLAHHNISIYGGGEDIPDGELFIKRNALCLSRKTDAGEITADGTISKPFFLFSDNTSQKEDIYFSMLKNQERRPESDNNPPVPLQFDVKHIIGLVQRLHSSEEHLQTRWMNALIGRVFLGLYKTTDVENFIRAKVTKKISRVKTPSFLSKIVLQRVDTGESAPYITNPRLKDLTADGDCVVEADVRYTGNFSLEIAATARIELGSRFKAREVDLVIAVVLKKIEGHMHVRIKPPPSNRIWYTFTSMPKIDMSIEPIVSSRQITYTFILRQIENRIKEVIAESIVMPFWDDTAFFSTEGKKWRGGVWVDDTMSHQGHSAEQEAAEHGNVEAVESIEAEPDPEGLSRSISTPAVEATPPSALHARHAAKSVFNLGGSTKNASSTSIDAAKLTTTEKPRAIRVGSFNSASTPVLTTDSSTADAFRTSSPPEHSHAAAAMAALAAKSTPVTPIGSPSRTSGLAVKEKAESFSSISSKESNGQNNGTQHAAEDLTEQSTPNAKTEKRRSTAQESLSESYGISPASTSASSLKSRSSHATTIDPKPLDSRTSTFSSVSTDSNSPSGNKRPTLTAVANAAATAKRWGLDALAARRAAQAAAKEAAAADLAKPMGRGRPLPPPGMPLPPPDRKTKTAPIPVPKRKQDTPPQPGTQDERQAASISYQKAAPPLPKRRSNSPIKKEDDSEGLFVVEVPDSEPTTPMVEAKQPSYVQPHVEDTEDADAPHDHMKPTIEHDTIVPDPIYRNTEVRTSTPPLPSRKQDSRPSTPPLPRRRRAARSISSSPEEDDHVLPSWAAAQEEEARSKTMWVDDDSGNLHQ